MIRLERRAHGARWTSPLVLVSSFFVALLITAALLAVSGQAPASTLRHIFTAAFTAPGAFTATLLSATPLVFTGFAAALAFRMRVWNIGGEGQLYAGAIGSSGVGLLLGGHVPLAIIVLAMVGAGLAAGAAWALLPAMLHTILGVSEILPTLMLNYVGALLMFYLIFDSTSFWRDLTTATGRVYPQGKLLTAGSFWPSITVGHVIVPTGFLIGIVTAGVLLAVLRSTTFGFKVRVIADAPEAGQYAGMSRRKMVLGVLLISGALAGLGGASEIGDFAHQLEPTALQQASFGYTGIVVAALARYNPVGSVLAAVLLGGLSNAGFTLQGPTFPLGLVGTIDGIILFCVLAGDVFTRYRVRLITRSHNRPDLTPHSGAPDEMPSDRLAVPAAPISPRGEVS